MDAPDGQLDSAPPYVRVSEKTTLLDNRVNKTWLSTFSQTEGFQYWPFAENSSTPKEAE